MIYKLLANGGVQRVSDGAFIPATTDNVDWVAYLAWRSLGNSPLPADPDPKPDPKKLQDGGLATLLLRKQVITQADLDTVLV